ncbi:conjugal transfer protein [Lactobacillus sp. CBA3605]|uniref:conjugal transfer protein n=1 Tax=Lactobacillus sp. CBA3605 TaxID=2099788 RepID=UPI000CFD602E|nr:conjugal transfer protein [Lactobacillus sp. CBA3605]AVK60535.1 conjugal transfer protein [Lactobacillus sp. CBA3605]
MRVRVKDFPVRYKNKRYLKNEELNIAQDAFNDGLFICLDTKKDDQLVDDDQSETDEE